jgi:ankyrin repeat protein
MFKLSLAGAIALGLVAVPAAAQRYSDGYTFLKSVRERNGGEVERLLAVPSSTVINTKDTSSEEGALHIVTRGRDLTWLAFLLSKGARADIQARDGTTALIIAAQLGWVEGADVLLRGRAPVDQSNRRGETPLIFAVQNRDQAMVRLLLSKGADPKRTDSSTGMSAIDHARRDPRAAAILKALQAPAAKPGREIAGPKL